MTGLILLLWVPLAVAAASLLRFQDAPTSKGFVLQTVLLIGLAMLLWVLARWHAAQATNHHSDQVTNKRHAPRASMSDRSVSVSVSTTDE